MAEAAKLYGVSAEFADSEALLAAAAALRTQDFGVVDAFSPLPIPGLDAALGLRGPSLGWIAVAGVLLGGFGCFGMIIYATVFSYPFDIAGRPPVSWPYYLVPSVAAASAAGAAIVVFAMLFLDRLPRLNHPVFNIDGIEGATQDRLFLAVEFRSEEADPTVVERFLADLPLRPLRIQLVPR
jgi:hypothetical protein